MKVLDISYGKHKTPGAVGLDNNPRTGADVIHDLDRVPYPFPDDEFDVVIGNQVIEHSRTCWPWSRNFTASRSRAA